MKRHWPAYVTEEALARIIEHALAEDVGSGDITTEATVPADVTGIGTFTVREAGILAGSAVAERVFRTLDPEVTFQWEASDGALVAPGMTVGYVQGRAAALLTAERTALNLMQRMSGIATLTRQMVEAVRPFQARILDTRKTAPGLRILDKWAVKLGSGENHRMGLYDQILIKDNHIAAAGSIGAAIERVHQYLQQKQLGDVFIEIETRRLSEVQEVVRVGGVHRILLDNMVRLLPDGQVDTSLLKEAVTYIGQQYETEASGNVTMETVHFIAATGVQYISSGLLTHSARALDISFTLTLA